MSGAVARLNRSSRSIAQRRFSGVEKSRKPKSTGFFSFSARGPCRNTQAHDVSITRSDWAASQARTSLTRVSRIQAPDRPAGVRAVERQALVQAERPVAPELD